MKKIIPLLLLAIGFTACNISTAKLSEEKICGTVSAEAMTCASDISSFPSDTPEIIVTTQLDNAPEATKITFQWRYLEGPNPELIDSIVVESPDVSPSYPNSTMPVPPSGTWPTGKYDIIISLDTDNSTPIVKEFTIE